MVPKTYVPSGAELQPGRRIVIGGLKPAPTAFGLSCIDPIDSGQETSFNFWIRSDIRLRINVGKQNKEPEFSIQESARRQRPRRLFRAGCFSSDS
jgi:hypothetical protein